MNTEFYPYPTIYSDNVVLGEYAGEQLQSCCFRNILELVGLFDLHVLCQTDGVASQKAAKAAIDKFNRQNQTRLTYECVRELTPTYSFAPIGDPIIYSSDLFEFKKRACQLILEFNGFFDDVDFNTINEVVRSIPMDGIDFVAVYYPVGFWVVYTSPFIQNRQVAEDSTFCMSDDSPVPGINLEQQFNQSYGFPPHEEASLKQNVLGTINFRRYATW